MGGKFGGAEKGSRDCSLPHGGPNSCCNQIAASGNELSPSAVSELARCETRNRRRSLEVDVTITS